MYSQAAVSFPNFRYIKTLLLTYLLPYSGLSREFGITHEKGLSCDDFLLYYFSLPWYL